MRRRKQGDARRKRRLALAVLGAVLLAVIAVPVYGYYASFIAPTREWAVKVRDTTLTYGDLVKRLRIQQAATRYLGGKVDLSTVPFQEVLNMAQNELIIQEAPKYGVVVTDEEIDQAIVDNFRPRVAKDEEVAPGQLEAEAREAYMNFLNASHLSEKDYRRLVKESLFRQKMQEELGQRVPTVAESVEVYMILIPITRQSDPSTRVDPDEIKKIAEQEGFREAIKALGSPGTGYADPKDGYVGWVPRGAFPKLDPYFFGDDKTEPAKLDEVVGPVATPDGWYIVKKVAGPETREVSDVMLDKMKQEALNRWLNDLWSQGTSEGWLAVRINSDLYDWVVRQVKASEPPVPTPTPSA